MKKIIQNGENTANEDYKLFSFRLSTFRNLGKKKYNLFSLFCLLKIIEIPLPKRRKYEAFFPNLSFKSKPNFGCKTRKINKRKKKVFYL